MMQDRWVIDACRVVDRKNHAAVHVSACLSGCDASVVSVQYAIHNMHNQKSKAWHGPNATIIRL